MLEELEVSGAIATRLSPDQRPLASGLIVVLESPHTKEFKGEPAPAAGATGRLLAKHLRTVVGALIVQNPPIVLMNAVQYQCSLGSLPKMHRDEVFAAVWDGGAREDFIRRLRQIYMPGDYVVCCCTQGIDIQRFGELRQKVLAAIVETVPSNKVLRRTHPSSWRSPINRTYEWESA